MNPRASRIADIVASVPEVTSRTRSTGVRATIASASSTSGRVGVPYDVPRVTARCTASMTCGCAWPSSIGPQLPTRSTYSVPSTSKRYGPCARSMKRGVPPTALKARTGELTPPGVTARARSSSAAEVEMSGSTSAFSPARGPDHEPGPGMLRCETRDPVSAA